jgi:D-alanyl-D-alanine carboxypeptidase
MSRLAVLTGIVALLVSTTGCTALPPPSAAGQRPDVAATIEAAANDQLHNGIIGSIVSLSDPAKGTYLKAFGRADTAGTPMTTDMHYRIGSVTKTFTGAAILRLVEEQKVALNDPISRYVDDIPHGDTITVGNLLAMRGGVYDLTRDAEFGHRLDVDPTFPGWTSDDALKIIRAHGGDFTSSDTKSVYSNSEYVLLGYVLQKASGQSAQNAISSLIAQLGLPDTTFPSNDTIPAPFCHGYTITGSPPAGSTPAGAYRDTTAINPLVPWAAGALISTVPDMTKYAPELATGVGLMPATAALRQTWGSLEGLGPRRQYGLGVARLGDWVGHEGSIGGYTDMVFYLPQQKATLVVMTNAADGNSEPAFDLWREVAHQLYPGSLPPA